MLDMCLSVQNGRRLPCTLYVKEGVKVRDVLDVRLALWNTFRKFVLCNVRRTTTRFYGGSYSSYSDDVEITVRVAQELDTPGRRQSHAVYWLTPTTAATAGSDRKRSEPSSGLAVSGPRGLG